jgi:hypothetical protein
MTMMREMMLMIKSSESSDDYHAGTKSEAESSVGKTLA